MKNADRTPEQRAVDRIITTAMAFYRVYHRSGVKYGDDLQGKLLRACARLDKVRHRVG